MNKCGGKEQHKQRLGGGKCLGGHKATPKGCRNKGEGRGSQCGPGLLAHPGVSLQAPGWGSRTRHTSTCGPNGRDTRGTCVPALCWGLLKPRLVSSSQEVILGGGQGRRWRSREINYHMASRERWAGSRLTLCPLQGSSETRGILELQGSA